MSALSRYLRQAFRTLMKVPGFTLTALFTLALGIGATTAMFATFYGALLKPLPFEDAGRLVMARTSWHGGPAISPVSAPDYFDYKAQIPSLQGFSALIYGPEKITIMGEAGAESIQVAIGADDLFQTLGLRPLAGRWFIPEEGQPGGAPVTVVSQAYALRRFGGAEEAVGKTLVAMKKPWTIIGVVPSAVDLLMKTDFWIPMRRDEDPAAAPRKYHNWRVVGRLKPGVSMAAAQSEVDLLSRQLAQQYPDSNTGKALGLMSLQEALVQDHKPILLLLMGAVGLVLLIACANVAGLLLARGAARRGELALRASLGATRGQIILQLLAESLLLAVVSGLVGLLLAKFLVKVLPIVSGLADQGLPAGGLDGMVLLFSLGISVLTGLLFGLAPALRASSSHQLAKDLAPGGRSLGGTVGIRLRSALVVGQVALSLSLLVGSSMLIRSFLRQTSAHPGFDPRHVLTGVIDLPADRYPDTARCNQFLDDLKQDLEGLPGVEAVSYHSHLPILQPYGDIAAWAPDEPAINVAERKTAFVRFVFPDSFRALGIPLIAGRDVTRADIQGRAPIMVLGQQMANSLFPGRDPIGQFVMLDRQAGPLACEVVGVVGDVAITRYGEAPQRTMYLPSRYAGGQSLVLRATGDPEGLLGSVRARLAARDRGLILDNLRPMEAQLARVMAPQKVSALTFSLFSGVALLLASMGLYGVLSYLVRQRAREIGIRMALGAQAHEVVWEITRQGLLLTVFGMGLGVVGSLAMGRLLAGQLYQISPADPLSMALGSLILGVVALGAVLIPAYQSTRVNPVTALRDG